MQAVRHTGVGSRAAVRGSRVPLRRVASAVLFGAALLLSFAVSVSAQSAGAGEYELKAAFLFNFTKFIDWPDSSFPASQSRFSVCVIGRDPFGGVLDTYFAGKTIDNHSVEIVRIGSAASIPADRRCQIAFVSASEQSHFREVIAAFRGEGVLLVGDARGFVSSGGTIELLLFQNRIRFAINPDAVTRADLKVSSKLLALATIAHDGSNDEAN
jgi:hypothetical protein